MSAESHFERAGELAGATVRPSGDTALVEVPHGDGVYSRFALDAACRLHTHDNGRRSVVVELEEGDGWFEATNDDAAIEVRRGRATIVATGAAVAVKGERDGRTIVVAVEGDVTVRPAEGDDVVLRSQAAMLDRSGRLGQIVDVTPEQAASEPWIAKNRALEPMPVPQERDPVAEPVVVEPDPLPLPVAVPVAAPAARTATEVIDLDDDVVTDEGSSHRRWPRMVMAAVLLIGAIALLLPRGTPDRDADDEVSSATVTSPSTTATTGPPTTAATVPDETPAQTPPAEPTAETTVATAKTDLPRSDAPFQNELVACRRAGGQVTFTGRLTNREAEEKSYRLHVIFTGAGGGVVERRQLELDVAPGDTEAWQVTSSAGSRLEGGSCDLERVEPLG